MFLNHLKFVLLVLGYTSGGITVLLLGICIWIRIFRVSFRRERLQNLLPYILLIFFCLTMHFGLVLLLLSHFTSHFGVPVEAQSPQVSSPPLGVYTVVAPRKIRPNMEYHVSVSVHQVSSPVEINVLIAGPADSGAHNSVSKFILLNTGETQILNFDIGEWGSGKYNLSVSGRGGILFENTTSLEYEHKSYSVFVQTDKSIYKPGHKVLFRVIVVNPYLVPTVTGAIDIHVTDAKQNRIKQWNRLLTRRGIVSESLQLSDNPVLGDWNIHITVLNQTFQKSFTVAEYVLPTYEVKVELPTFATYNKSDIVVTVKAFYTYGKPVKGEVTLTVAPLTRYNYLTVRPYEQFQTKAKIDGSVDIYMTLRNDLSLKTDFFEREIEFFALVEEELTGRKYNSTNTMMIYDKEIKVELIKTSHTFKPGLKYTAYLKVAYQDDTPVRENRGQLKLLSGYSYNEENWKPAFYDVPANGLLELTFNPPHDPDINVLSLRAEYAKQLYYIENIEAALSPSNNYIQVVMLTQEPKVNQEAEFEVTATEPITQLVYEVMGRGDIVAAQAVPVQNQTTFRFHITLNHRMAPKARVLVYYVRSENGEVVADSVNFQLEGSFRTDVKIEADTREAKPGERVNIRVRTKPNAYVGLLGIDQSVLLLKSGNDITQNQVIKELESYDSGKPERHLPVGRRSLWWTGSQSAGQIFEDSGVVMVSNGFVFKYEQLIFYRMSFQDMERFSDVEDRSANYDRQSNSPPAQGNQKTPKLRKYFPETWIWNATVAGSDGLAGLASNIPDTITSWVISAFAMDPITGLGIAPTTAKVTVFRPFFIKLNLPYSVLRGESVAIQVIVFNYLKKPIQAEVTMENRDGEFEFVVAGNEVNEDSKLTQKTKQVTVLPEDGTAVSFLVTPLKLGNIDIRVTASSTLAGDRVQKKLLVKPEGSPQYFNKGVLVDLRNPSTRVFKQNISVPVPKNAVEGSTRITVSAIGDLLGPSVNNLDGLLKMPTGCGEQNLLNFVPNIVITEYLRRAGRLTPEVETKAREFTESGYQRELTYKRDNGSFSAFGNRDKDGSTWLTAFVVKSFLQAKSFISIDDQVIDVAQKWLIQRQQADGSFQEVGEVHYKAMQGGSGSSGAALTAFVLIALLENQNQRAFGREILAAQQYLVRELRATDDPYALAIGTYALNLADDPSKDAMLQKLNSYAKKEGEMMYWTQNSSYINSTDKHSDYFFLPASQDVEMTAYALLTYALRGDINGGLPVMRWLISQQNENGGFASTQDTVVGIQALAKMASSLVSSTISIDVKLNYSGDRQRALRINSDNAVILQRLDMPNDTRYIEIEATGYGVALIQVSWSFNLYVSGEDPPFYLNALLDKTSSESYLQLSVCTFYKEEEPTNMAVMEVGLPSGYLADVDALPSILQIPRVKRVESDHGDTSVNIYFDKIDKEELCVTVPAHRTFKVAHQKRAPVKIYDYYNLAKSSRMFYYPHEAKLCDICDDNDCSDGCNIVERKEGEKQGANNNPSLASAMQTNCALLFALVLTLVLV